MTTKTKGPDQGSVTSEQDGTSNGNDGASNPNRKGSKDSTNRKFSDKLRRSFTLDQRSVESKQDGTSNGNDGAKNGYGKRPSVLINHDKTEAEESSKSVSTPSSWLRCCYSSSSKGFTWQKLSLTKGKGSKPESQELRKASKESDGSTKSSSTRTDSKWIWWPVLFPDCRPTLVWDTISLFFIIFELLSIPYRMSFNSPAKGIFKGLEDCCLFFFLCDICLQFSQGFVQHGLPVVDPACIIRRYVQGGFWTDLVASFLPLVSDSLQGLRLVRIFKLRKVLDRIEIFASMFAWGYFCISLFRVISNMMLLCHFCACLWYSVGVYGLPESCKDPRPWMCKEQEDYWAWFVHIDWSDSSWQGDNNLLVLYLNSMYFAMTTITTVGYGDIHPISMFEKQFAVLMLLVAIIAFSSGASEIAEMIKAVNLEKNEQNNQMQELTRYMRWRHLPYNLQIRLRQYLCYRWEHESDLAQKEEKFLAQISPWLRKQVCNHLFGKQLRDVPFLKWATNHQAAFETIVEGCSSIFRAQGEMLFSKGQMDTTVHIVTHGRIAIINKDEEQEDDTRLAQKLIETISYMAENGTSMNHSEEWVPPQVDVLDAPCHIGGSLIWTLDKIRPTKTKKMQSVIKQIVQKKSSSDGTLSPLSSVNARTFSDESLLSNLSEESSDLSCRREYTAICLNHCKLTMLDVATIAKMLKEYPFVWSDYDVFKQEQEMEGNWSSSAQAPEDTSSEKLTNHSSSPSKQSLHKLSISDLSKQLVAKEERPKEQASRSGDPLSNEQQSFQSGCPTSLDRKKVHPTPETKSVPIEITSQEGQQNKPSPPLPRAASSDSMRSRAWVAEDIKVMVRNEMLQLEQNIGRTIKTAVSEVVQAEMSSMKKVLAESLHTSGASMEACERKDPISSALGVTSGSAGRPKSAQSTATSATSLSAASLRQQSTDKLDHLIESLDRHLSKLSKQFRQQHQQSEDKLVHLETLVKDLQASNSTFANVTAVQQSEASLCQELEDVMPKELQVKASQGQDDLMSLVTSIHRQSTQKLEHLEMLIKDIPKSNSSLHIPADSSQTILSQDVKPIKQTLQQELTTSQHELRKMMRNDLHSAISSLQGVLSQMLHANKEESIHRDNDLQMFLKEVRLMIRREVDPELIEDAEPLSPTIC